MATKKNQSSFYVVKVWGESESHWSGAQPDSIEPLLESASNKNTAALRFKITQTQVEMLCNAGKTEEAARVVKNYEEAEKRIYQAPLNVFPRDNQNGNHPYIGAHSFFGAFRDCANYRYPEFFYQKKGDKSPSKKHLRKSIQIRPHHIFLYRNENVIEKIDAIEGQQPIGEAKGFARYEIIRHPFVFSWKMQVLTDALFSEFLSDQEKVIAVIQQSSFHGQGGRRGVGYGEWKVTKYEITDSL